jgi:hypothetical protein
MPLNIVASTSSKSTLSQELVRTQLEALSKTIEEMKAANEKYDAASDDDMKAALKSAKEAVEKAYQIQLRLTAVKLGKGRKTLRRRKHRKTRSATRRHR